MARIREHRDQAAPEPQDFDVAAFAQFVDRERADDGRSRDRRRHLAVQLPDAVGEHEARIGGVPQADAGGSGALVRDGAGGIHRQARFRARQL
jgi:hypothetical protein